MGGERAARRITNSIRPGRLASLLANGEAQTDANVSEACRAEGLCVKATAGAVRWVETGCTEGQTPKQRDPRGTSRCSSSAGVDAKSRLVEVRAFIVATNRGNARGAKGRREMDA